MNFIKKIKKIRELFCLSEYQFSKIVDIPVSTINDWEKGDMYPTKAEVKKIADVFMLKEDNLTSKKRIKLHLMKVNLENYNFILNNVYYNLKFNRIIKQKKLLSRKFTIISLICMIFSLVITALINIVLFSVVLVVAWLPLIIWIFFMHYYPLHLFDSVFDLDFEMMKGNSKFTPVKIFKNKVFQDSLCNKVLLENKEGISVLSYCLLDGYAFERIRKKTYYKKHFFYKGVLYIKDISYKKTKSKKFRKRKKKEFDFGV